MKTIIRILCGSHLYGTALPTSDEDFKEVYIPDGKDVLLQRANKVHTSTSETLDVERFPIQSYLKLLCEGQTVAMDLLFAPSGFYRMEPTEEWVKILEHRDHFVSRQCKAFVGYCRQQAGKYSVKADRMGALGEVVGLLRQALNQCENRSMDENKRGGALGALFDLALDGHNPYIKMEERTGPQGKVVHHLSVCETLVPVSASIKVALDTYDSKLSRYGERARQAQNMGSKDWKALYHAVRVAEEALELLKTGKITFPRPEREFLLEIRQGKVAHEVISDLLEQNLAKLDEAVEKSHLPEKPDFAKAEEMVENFHFDAVHRELVARAKTRLFCKQ